MNELLSKKEVKTLLSDHSGWTYNGNRIKREVLFDHYMDSIEFVNSLAIKAENLDHHPNLSIGYCNIIVELTSHDLGGVTVDCLELVKYIEFLIPGLYKKC